MTARDDSSSPAAPPEFDGAAQRITGPPPHAAALAALSRRSTGRSLLALAVHVAVIVAAATAAAWTARPWAACLAVLIIGTRQYALGEVLVHEASHRNLSARLWLNDALGTMLSWPFFFTFEGYRRFHLQHHRLALDDPQNSILEEYQDWRLPLSEERLSRRRLVWLLVLRPLVGVIALYHLWGIASDAYYDSDLKENTAMWLFWGLLVALLWPLGWLGYLFLYWLAPLFLVFASLNYWSEVSDHYRTSGLLTRSYTAGWWNRLIAGNIGYHVVHHRYPGIPWFRIKAASDQFGGDLSGQTSDSLVAMLAQIQEGHQQVRAI
jgi:fatty acid desaturase